MKPIIPSPAETIVLQFLWEQGQANVRQLHDHICLSGDVGYTTVLKRMQRMEEKKLIRRIPGTNRAINYEAALQPKKTRKTLVERLIKSAFENSPNALIQHAIGQHNLTNEDIKEIRSMLDQIEKKVVK